jgi:predicted MFS family arabinose efflux permease
VADHISYLQVLRTPGVLRVFLPALLGRLSLAMVSLALLLAVVDATGSFAIAGLMTGAFGLANVIASPWRARLVDRWGQRRVLNLLALTNAASLCFLAYLLSQGADTVLFLGIVAVLTGLSTPPLGASMRVLWASVTPAGPVRTRAYSVDAVAEELTFTTGPVAIAAIIAATSPLAGLLVTAAVVVTGTIGMTSGPVSAQQKGAPQRLASEDKPLRQKGFIPNLIILLGVGIVLGAIEVAVPATADRGNSVALAGWLLSAFAAGSAIGGLLYGQRTWRSSLRSRLVVLCALMSAGTIALAFVDSILVSVLILVAVGFFLAPSLITGYLVADSITAPAARTEASSWINTSVNLGASLSAAAVGLIVDRSSPGTALLIGGSTALILTATMWLTTRRPAQLDQK